jgi:hypothetical protein
MALALGGCGGANGSDKADSASSYLAAVTRAAYATDQVPGYKFDMTIDSKINEKTFTIAGSGSIGARGAQGSLNMTVAGKTITTIIDKPYVYVKVPAGAKASVTKGKPWLRADIGVVSESVGAGELPTGGSTDPTQTLSYLKSAGTVSRVGREDVRGKPATRYHAVIDLHRYGAVVPADERAAASKYAETLERTTGSSSLPVDVWIDDHSHVLRMSLTLSLCSPDGGRLGEDVNMELHDYGPQPVPVAPSSSQVTDISDTLRSQIAKGVQQLSCR